MKHEPPVQEFVAAARRMAEKARAAVEEARRDVEESHRHLSKAIHTLEIANEALRKAEMRAQGATA